MREILFRGKRVDNGEWVRGWYIDGFICSDLAVVDCENFMPEIWCEVIPETVCQYTGLKDRNGRKIFEGDIMALDGWASAHSYEYPCEGDECTVRAEIIFHEGKFMPELLPEYDDLELLEDAFEVYKGHIPGEVIGSKFDVEVENESKRV